MKNTINVLCNLNRDQRSNVPFLIIAFIAVIGFYFTACSDDSGSVAAVKVVNNYSKPVTKVEINPRGTDGKIESTEVIAAGSAKTFNVTFGTNVTGANSTIILYAEGIEIIDSIFSGWGMTPTLGQAILNRMLELGNTTTITLTSDGKIE